MESEIKQIIEREYREREIILRELIKHEIGNSRDLIKDIVKEVNNEDEKENGKDKILTELYDRISLLKKYGGIEICKDGSFKEIVTVKYDDILKVLEDFNKNIFRNFL